MLPSSNTGMPVSSTRVPARDKEVDSVVALLPTGRSANNPGSAPVRRLDERRSSVWSDIVYDEA